jgi:glycosyltransferase involved in cell wall biosynthesis
MDLKVGVLHPGTQHSWQTALAFQESNQLVWFLTSVYFKNTFIEKDIFRFLPEHVNAKIKRELSRRNFSALDDSLVERYGFYEWLEILCQRFGFRDYAIKLDRRGNENFYKGFLKSLNKTPVNVIWGFNNSSLESFTHAKKYGIKCVLDQTIGHPSSYNNIISKAQSEFPDYFFENSNYCKEKWLLERNSEEAELADIIVVGSEFCAETMVKNGCQEKKIRIIPYGFDEKLFSDSFNKKEFESKLKFIFVGSVIPRKGIHFLIEAFKMIDPEVATLTIVGGVGVPSKVTAALPENITIVGSVPRAEVVQYYHAADIFIFPSLFEGGGIVLYEAAAAGLAIIQTKACGDGVRNGNGVIIENVSVETILESINYMINNRSAVDVMKNRSVEIKNERSWEKYRSDVRSLASGLLK